MKPIGTDLESLNSLIQEVKKTLGGIKTNEEILQKIDENNSLINSFKIKTKVDVI